MLCVLKNFKFLYEDELKEGKGSSNQHILVGNPGVGKSCILVLLCFYIAVKHSRTVVWYKQVPGDCEKSVTRVLHEGSFYQHADLEGKEYEHLYDFLVAQDRTLSPTKCWFCLDGMPQEDIEQRDWRNMFKLLATSGQFISKGEGRLFQRLCIVHYWRQDDMELLAREVGYPPESEADSQYFVSGGNLREFLNPDPTKVKDIMREAANRATTTADANRLLTAITFNFEHYILPTFWTCCVTSKLVLQHAQKWSGPILCQAQTNRSWDGRRTPWKCSLRRIFSCAGSTPTRHPAALVQVS